VLRDRLKGSESCSARGGLHRAHEHSGRILLEDAEGIKRFSKEPMREKRRNEEPGSGANRNLKDEQQHFLIAFSPVPSWRFRQC